MPGHAAVGGSECPDVLVLFGATGDLARRMIWPSLFHLVRDGLLPSGLRVVAVGRKPMEVQAWRAQLATALREFLPDDIVDAKVLQDLLDRVDYATAAVDEAGAFDAGTLATRLQTCGRVLYFLSVSPAHYGAICRGLGAAGLVNAASRIILEKPIGHDQESGRVINAAVAEVFGETQVFRIDHYLGKETVQNLAALRFGNSLFEPLWNAQHIDNVQITVAETVGVEGRWSYYDDAGALRDMVQNHLLQLVALVAMEPPQSLDPDAVRTEKVKVLRSLRPITGAEVSTHTVRGQYTAGVAHGQAAPGYNEEAGARRGSHTETFVALRAEVQNWRWAGVPFYLRTGKRLQARRSDIVIQFKPVPHNIFALDHHAPPPNRLVIRLQPEERITLEVMGKRPGLDGVRLQPLHLDLSLSDAFGKQRSRIAYERLLLDAIKGNNTLFVRRDEVEAAWQFIDGIQKGWRDTAQQPRPYPAGTWGPSAAIALAERHGHSWYE
ncbi:MAG: glucose-6-phosphate dehydrogenase [Pseudomonadota bacterium]